MNRLMSLVVVALLLGQNAMAAQFSDSENGSLRSADFHLRAIALGEDPSARNRIELPGPGEGGYQQALQLRHDLAVALEDAIAVLTSVENGQESGPEARLTAFFRAWRTARALRIVPGGQQQARDQAATAIERRALALGASCIDGVVLLDAAAAEPQWVRCTAHQPPHPVNCPALAPTATDVAADTPAGQPAGPQP